ITARSCQNAVAPVKESSLLYFTIQGLSGSRIEVGRDGVHQLQMMKVNYEGNSTLRIMDLDSKTQVTFDYERNENTLTFTITGELCADGNPIRYKAKLSSKPSGHAFARE